jgi:putative endonuclease
VFEDVNAAILREKELKGWGREKKRILITNFNPDWEFLNHDIF